jgi:plastocyanin
VVKHQSICGNWKWSEELLASPARGLGNVVVTIEGAPALDRPPQAGAVLDNRECVFVPHVQVVRAGEVLEIRSSDRLIHTAHAYDEAKRTLFNVALPVSRPLVRRTLANPGTYRIGCDVGHTWMSAYVVVVDHPYAAVTDALGGFRISGVPPGAYRLRFWHERLGVREEPLVIRAGGEATVNLAWRVDGAAATGSRPPLAVPIERAP